MGFWKLEKRKGCILIVKPYLSLRFKATMTIQLARKNASEFSSFQSFKLTKKCYTNAFVLREVNTYR